MCGTFLSRAFLKEIIKFPFLPAISSTTKYMQAFYLFSTLSQKEELLHIYSRAQVMWDGHRGQDPRGLMICCSNHDQTNCYQKKKIISILYKIGICKIEESCKTQFQKWYGAKPKTAEETPHDFWSSWWDFYAQMNVERKNWNIKYLFWKVFRDSSWKRFVCAYYYFI